MMNTPNAPDRQADAGLSTGWFMMALQGCEASDEAQWAAIKICRAYGIKGLADPAYIANVIDQQMEA